MRLWVVKWTAVNGMGVSTRTKSNKNCSRSKHVKKAGYLFRQKLVILNGIQLVFWAKSSLNNSNKPAPLDHSLWKQYCTTLTRNQFSDICLFHDVNNNWNVDNYLRRQKKPLRHPKAMFWGSLKRNVKNPFMSGAKAYKSVSTIKENILKNKINFKI